MLLPVFSSDFKKKYQKLPKLYQSKFKKQLAYLLQNPNHPSLRTRKMGGLNTFEGRLDKHYRFTYSINNSEMWLLTIGPHDEGLGKK